MPKKTAEQLDREITEVLAGRSPSEAVRIAQAAQDAKDVRSKRTSKPEKKPKRIFWVVQQREHSGSRSWSDIGDWHSSEQKANAYLRSIVKGGTNAPNLFRVNKIVT